MFRLMNKETGLENGNSGEDHLTLLLGQSLKNFKNRIISVFQVHSIIYISKAVNELCTVIGRPVWKIVLADSFDTYRTIKNRTP